MIPAISSMPSQPVAPTAPASQAPSPETGSKASSARSAAPADTVTLSSTAQAMAKEMSETSVQTQQEAARGDLQAKHLLAREAAARAL